MSKEKIYKPTAYAMCYLDWLPYKLKKKLCYVFKVSIIILFTTIILITNNPILY